MKKRALYDNPAGYGHGGLGYHHSLDELPPGLPPAGQVPAWLPWLGLGGAALVGAAGLKGLGRLFKRAPQTTKAIDPAAAYAQEMMGRVDPRWERMARSAEERMAAQQARLAREEMFKKEREISRQAAAAAAPEGAQFYSPTLGKYGSVISALGRIARGD